MKKMIAGAILLFLAVVSNAERSWVYTPVTRVFTDGSNYAAVIHGQIYLLASGHQFGKWGYGARFDSIVRDIPTNGTPMVQLYLREVPVSWTIENLAGGKRYVGLAVFHLTPGFEIEHCNIFAPSHNGRRRGYLSRELTALGLPQATH